MATNTESIDLEKICKKYHELLKAEFDLVDNMNNPPQRKIAFTKEKEHDSPQGKKPTAGDTAVDLRHVKLEVENIQWNKDPGQIESVQKTRKFRYGNPKKEPDVFAHVKATPNMDAAFKVVITKGLCKDFGRSLYLPLPGSMKDSMGPHIEINPGQKKTKKDYNMPLEATLGRETLPEQGATAVVKSEEKRFEGTFTCEVHPKGKVMINLTTNPKIQDVIRELKDHEEEEVNSLVSRFDAKKKKDSQSHSGDKMDRDPESTDEVDISDERKFYWKLEGYCDFRWDFEHTMHWDVAESKDKDEEKSKLNDSGHGDQ